MNFTDDVFNLILSYAGESMIEKQRRLSKQIPKIIRLVRQGTEYTGGNIRWFVKLPMSIKYPRVSPYPRFLHHYPPTDVEYIFGLHPFPSSPHLQFKDEMYWEDLRRWNKDNKEDGLCRFPLTNFGASARISKN